MTTIFTPELSKKYPYLLPGSWLACFPQCRLTHQDCQHADIGGVTSSSTETNIIIEEYSGLEYQSCADHLKVEPELLNSNVSK